MTDSKNKFERKAAISHGQLTVEAELLDIGFPVPRPGVMYVISLMRYKVLRVIRGRYPHQFILVGHHVPDLNSPQFQIGVLHRLDLTGRFPKHASILNKFDDEARDLGIFFCLSFDTITASYDNQ
ncbi:MAG: hypothetical protein LUQ20_02215 [Candidatus Methanoperedens sp.]|nr:hypothetical protein [Candidatus Methanoperedens sp.]